MGACEQIILTARNALAHREMVRQFRARHVSSALSEDKLCISQVYAQYTGSNFAAHMLDPGLGVFGFSVAHALTSRHSDMGGGLETQSLQCESLHLWTPEPTEI